MAAVATAAVDMEFAAAVEAVVDAAAAAIAGCGGLDIE